MSWLDMPPCGPELCSGGNAGPAVISQINVGDAVGSHSVQALVLSELPRSTSLRKAMFSTSSLTAWASPVTGSAFLLLAILGLLTLRRSSIQQEHVVSAAWLPLEGLINKPAPMQ